MCLTSPTYRGSEYKNVIQWMYSSDHLILRWGKNIWFIELTDDKHYLVYRSFIVCLLWWNITCQNYWRNCLLSRPSWWLTVYFLLDVRTEHWSLLSSCFSQEIWLKILLLDLRDWVKGERGEARGGWMSRIPDSVVRCHWRMLAFNIQTLVSVSTQ